MQYDTGLMSRALLRLLELGGYQQGEKTLLHFSSPSHFPLSYRSLQCRCKHFIMVMTRAHASMPRRIRSIYNPPSSMSASSSNCTSISYFTSAHAGCQLEAQVEFYELTIQALMQTEAARPVHLALPTIYVVPPLPSPAGLEPVQYAAFVSRPSSYGSCVPSSDHRIRTLTM